MTFLRITYYRHNASIKSEIGLNGLSTAFFYALLQFSKDRTWPLAWTIAGLYRLARQRADGRVVHFQVVIIGGRARCINELPSPVTKNLVQSRSVCYRLVDVPKICLPLIASAPGYPK